MSVKKEKILVAMSGGVDSSVAVTLLLDEGYDVTGAFMVNYNASDTNDANFNANDANHANVANATCWLSDYRDALRVVAKLGIPLIKLDFTKEYNDFVLDYMFREYEVGMTPNPDVLCNKFVKFGVWLERCRELGFDKLATGHYARVTSHKSRTTSQRNQSQVTGYRLQVSRDSNKDQTYFLHQLTQNQLQHVLFPLGKYTKVEVRKIARKKGLPTAEKGESMGICFVGEVPMREFLLPKIKSKPGKIVMSSGEVVGEHEGLAFYTIGQRHFNLSFRAKSERSGDVVKESLLEKVKDRKNKKLKDQEVKKNKNHETPPLYVVAKNFEKNQLIVGYENDPLLYKKGIIVKEINWIAGRKPDFPLKCKIRLRYRQSLQSGQITDSGKQVIVKFKKPQRAVTPGQFAVFYKKDECLGGGVIQS